MALEFASKAFTQLEITHFKDNFKTLADHQDGLEYWKEETLRRFLSLPDSVHAGSVLYSMCTYLGSFPFPSLAPCILTREATLKVVTLLTERYRKVLKKGREDKVKLLFRSLAVFDRRASLLEEEKTRAREAVKKDDELGLGDARSYLSGFAIDEPLNQDEEEDDDDLVLAALESLDAIEVFKHDQKTDRKIHHAHIPVDTLKHLVMLLLVLFSTGPQDNLADFCSDMDQAVMASLESSAGSIVAAFDPDIVHNGVRYRQFVQSTTTCLPHLFKPLSPLFEHFLFSKNIDLSRHRAVIMQSGQHIQEKISPIQQPAETAGTPILNDVTLAQLGMFTNFGQNLNNGASNTWYTRTRFNQIYSTAAHGTSMSSFNRQVLSWSSPSLILVAGTLVDSNEQILLGAFLPEKWREGVHQAEEPNSGKAIMFQLRPRHAVFPANPYNKSTPVSYLSNKTGVALGCVIPSQSRTNTSPLSPILGPVALSIDSDLATAIFQHNGEAGIGAFLTDTGLEEAQRSSPGRAQAKKLEFDIDGLEVWGISALEAGSEDAVTLQKQKLDWDEAEAARRRGVNFGGDKDGARALLEMAGLVGDDAQNRTGGSM